jgi:hypothetical protein
VSAESKIKLFGERMKLFGKNIRNFDTDIYTLGHKYYWDNDAVSEKEFNGMYFINDEIILYSKDCSIELGAVLEDKMINGIKVIKNFELKQIYQHNQGYGDEFLDSLAVVLPKHTKGKTEIYTNSKLYIFNDIDSVSGDCGCGSDGAFIILHYLHTADRVYDAYLYFENTLYRMIYNKYYYVHKDKSGLVCFEPVRQCDKQWLIVDYDYNDILFTSTQEITIGYTNNQSAFYINGNMIDLDTLNIRVHEDDE